MRKFDLEAAKSGARVVTRGGDAVKFIAHVPEAPERQRVVWFDGHTVETCRDNGVYSWDGAESSLDLFLADDDREVTDAECDAWLARAGYIREQWTGSEWRQFRPLAVYAIRERERAAGGAR